MSQKNYRTNTFTRLARMLVAVETGSRRMKLPFSQELWEVYGKKAKQNYLFNTTTRLLGTSYQPSFSASYR